MRIERLYTKNFLRNYDYILTTDCGKTIVLDPSDLRLLKRSLKTKVDYYFITHEHGDHIVGLAELQSLFGGEVVAWKGLQGKMPVDVDRPVQHGDFLNFEKESFRIIYIPGHITTHIGFIHCQGQDRRGGLGETAAFLGDTVFNGGVGNTRSGSPSVLWETMRDQVFTLHPEMVLYPEHDYWESNLGFTLSLEKDNQKAAQLLNEYRNGPYRDNGEFPASTLAQEREYNLFFRTHLPHVRSLICKSCHLPEDCLEHDLFVALRSLRDRW